MCAYVNGRRVYFLQEFLLRGVEAATRADDLQAAEHVCTRPLTVNSCNTTRECFFETGNQIA